MGPPCAATVDDWHTDPERQLQFETLVQGPRIRVILEAFRKRTF